MPRPIIPLTMPNHNTHGTAQSTSVLPLLCPQRSALVPISRFITAKGADPSQLRLLEVAAGTGRFHTFIKDNWPTLGTVCSDLSPFYLQV